MRLSVSNLAWPPECEGAILDPLFQRGVRGIEVAPTRLAPWDELNSADLRSFRVRTADAGLAVSSLQAILFGKTDLSLLGDALSFGALMDHMKRVAEIADTLGAAALVFGSPRHRSRGDLPVADAWSLARERWHILGELVATAHAVIGIEPVPTYYGGDFLASWVDVLRMVQEVNHPSIRVHLDTACVALGGDSIKDAIPACLPWLVHFHAAQPDLANFEEPAANHAAAARALRDAGYDKWVAIEMREQPGDPVAATLQAVDAINGLYFS